MQKSVVKDIIKGQNQTVSMTEKYGVTQWTSSFYLYSTAQFTFQSLLIALEDNTV
jgi:hypothetical protein